MRFGRASSVLLALASAAFWCHAHAAGWQAATVPNLIGHAYEEARSLVPPEVSVRWKSGAGDREFIKVPGMLDIVIWQWPLPGTPLNPGEGLTAVCTDTVAVPRLLDMRVSAARQVAAERGLRLVVAPDGRELNQFDDQKIAVDQTTLPGTLVRVGASIPVVLVNSGAGDSSSGFWLLAVGMLGALVGVSLALGLRR